MVDNNKQGNLHPRLISGGCRVSRAQCLTTESQQCTETPLWRSVTVPSRWFQHLAPSQQHPWNSSHCGNDVRSIYSMDGGMGEDSPMARVQFVDQPVATSSQGPPPASFFFSPLLHQHRGVQEQCRQFQFANRVDPCNSSKQRGKRPLPSSGFATLTTNKSKSEAPMQEVGKRFKREGVYLYL